jgi:Domain of unknown function (DUF5076)
VTRVAHSFEVYDELPLPSEALAQGGVEMLRAGVVEDELFITARRVFDDPRQWGGLLADVAQRLAILYAAEADVEPREVATLIKRGFESSLTALYAPPAGRRKAAAKRAAPRARRRTKRKPARAQARAKS